MSSDIIRVASSNGAAALTTPSLPPSPGHSNPTDGIVSEGVGATSPHSVPEEGGHHHGSVLQERATQTEAQSTLLPQSLLWDSGQVTQTSWALIFMPIKWSREQQK